MEAKISKARQRRIGLGLAAAILGAWLAVHAGAIFFWHWSWQTGWVAAVLVIAQTWLSTGLFITAHDAMHGSLAPGRPRLNRAIGVVCLALYAGLSYRALAVSHAAHHRSPGTADDPDFHAPEPRRAVPWFVAFFASYYTHAQLLRITAVAILYLLIGASLLNIAIFWAVPALLALGQLFYFGTYLPHRHEEGAFADEHRARSSAFKPLMSLLTCFHFGGYHHEHHLSPATPWWLLPAFRRGRTAG